MSMSRDPPAHNPTLEEAQAIRTYVVTSDLNGLHAICNTTYKRCCAALHAIRPGAYMYPGYIFASLSQQPGSPHILQLAFRGPNPLRKSLSLSLPLPSANIPSPSPRLTPSRTVILDWILDPIKWERSPANAKESFLKAKTAPLNRTLFMEACAIPAGQHTRALLQRLHNLGMFIPGDEKRHDAEGHCAAHIAMHMRNLTALEWMKDTGVNLLVKSAVGESTCGHIAVRDGYFEGIVKLWSWNTGVTEVVDGKGRKLVQLALEKYGIGGKMYWDLYNTIPGFLDAEELGLPEPLNPPYRSPGSLLASGGVLGGSVASTGSGTGSQQGRVGPQSSPLNRLAQLNRTGMKTEGTPGKYQLSPVSEETEEPKPAPKTPRHSPISTSASCYAQYPLSHPSGRLTHPSQLNRPGIKTAGACGGPQLSPVLKGTDEPKVGPETSHQSPTMSALSSYYAQHPLSQAAGSRNHLAHLYQPKIQTEGTTGAPELSPVLADDSGPETGQFYHLSNQMTQPQRPPSRPTGRVSTTPTRSRFNNHNSRARMAPYQRTPQTVRAAPRAEQPESSQPRSLDNASMASGMLVADEFQSLETSQDANWVSGSPPTYGLGINTWGHSENSGFF